MQKSNESCAPRLSGDVVFESAVNILIGRL